MKFVLIGILLTWFCVILYAQPNISCDIVSLSKIALVENPNIQQGVNNIENADARFLVQKGAFDYFLYSEASYSNLRKNTLNNDNTNSIIDGEFLLNRNADYTLGIQKEFRTGLHANLSTGYTLNSKNYLINSFGETVDPFTAEHVSNTRLSLTQPLLKGRGKKVTTAYERIAKTNIQNVKNNYNYSVSYEIMQLSNAYWQFLAAFRNLEIFIANEKRVQHILEVTKELVDADKRPEGDLAQIYADLADQQRQTKVAEQNLIEAKVHLGSVVGLSSQSSIALSEPISTFPEVNRSGFNEDLQIATYVEIANNNRQDIKATQKTIETLELKKYAAKIELKPKLDLSGFVSHNGQGIGNGFDQIIGTLIGNEGSSIAGGLNLSLTLPVNNNSAKGKFIQAESSLMNQHIANENLKRNIQLNVYTALNNLQTSVLVLKKAEESLGYHRKAYENEETKFQNGLTTLLNLLIFQERLTYAELEYLQKHQQFANAIVKLRYETGTLVTQSESGIPYVSKETFYTLPIQN